MKAQISSFEVILSLGTGIFITVGLGPLCQRSVGTDYIVTSSSGMSFLCQLVLILGIITNVITDRSLATSMSQSSQSAEVILTLINQHPDRKNANVRSISSLFFGKTKEMLIFSPKKNL